MSKDGDDESEKDFNKYDIDFFSSNNSNSISNDRPKDNLKKSDKIDNIESNHENNFKMKNKVVNNNQKYSISKLNKIRSIKCEGNESIIFHNNFSYTTKGDSNSSNEKFNFFENNHVINDSFNSNSNNCLLNGNNQNKSNSFNFNFPNDNYSNNNLFMSSNHLSNNINNNNNDNQYLNNRNINIIDNNIHFQNIKCLKSNNNINSFVNNNPINNIYYKYFNKYYILNSLKNNIKNNVTFQNNLNLNESQILKNNSIIKNNINDISPISEMYKNAIDPPKYIIHIEKILKGKDKRTTLIIRNIPNKYTISSILQDINQYFNHKFNVVYLPQDINNKSNLGYGFYRFCRSYAYSFIL